MLTQKSLMERALSEQFEHMPDTRRSIFLKDFPWLAWLFERGLGHPVIQFYVSRITLEFLRLTPIPKEWIFFVDKGGKIIYWQEEVQKRSNLFFFWRKKAVMEGRWFVPKHSSVECVFILNLADRLEEIFYAVSYFRGSGAVIVYKSPKDFSIIDWIKALKQRADAELAEEIQKIDAEPDELGIKT